MTARPPLAGEAASEPPSSRRTFAFHGPRVSLALGLAVLTYLLFPASPAVDLPIYEVGSVAPDNVIAPFALHVLKTPRDLEEEREAAARDVDPIYTFVPAALDSARQSLIAFGSAVAQAANTDPQLATAAVQRTAAIWGLRLPPDQAEYLATERYRTALLLALSHVFDRWLAAGVANASALDSVRGEIVIRSHGEERQLPADSVATFSTLVSRARLMHPDPRSAPADALYMRLLASFFHPTIVLDRAATELRRDDVRRAVRIAKYDVLAGEKIVGANEVVGREENDKMRALHDATGGSVRPARGAQRIAGAILFDFLLIALLGLALAEFRPEVYANLRWLVAISMAAGLVLFGGALVTLLRPVRPELVPVALAAVVISALFDRRISVIAAMMLATLVAGQNVYRGTNALFINLVGGAVAALTVGTIRRRNQAYQWILMIAAAYVVTAVAIGLTLDRPSREILASAGFGVLNAVACVLLAFLVLPIAEAFTGIETDLTLLEWSDLNRALMQRMSLEAPGTYAHTIAIANLSEVAARAIGANALLARVGAYYHDIGKLLTPQYFVENQAKGRNPHDALRPNDSALIIRDHITEGLTLAEQYKLPRALRAFIAEHHGTGTIAFFLDKARQQDADPPNVADYTYPGPRPRTAETAVVMLADGIEASARVLHDPTPEAVREVVEHIVNLRVNQGQLDEAPLTLQQLEIIKDAFTRALVGIYHNRIEYPKESGGVSSGFAKI